MSLTPERTAELQELCRQYRIDVLTAIHGAQSGHPGGSLSACEILTLLYQQRMHVDARIATALCSARGTLRPCSTAT